MKWRIFLAGEIVCTVTALTRSDAIERAREIFGPADYWPILKPENLR